MGFLAIALFLSRPAPQTQTKPVSPVVVCASLDGYVSPGAPCSPGFFMTQPGGALWGTFYISAVPGFSGAPFFVFNGSETIQLGVKP